MHGLGWATAAPAGAAMTVVRKPVIEQAAEDSFVSEVLSYSGAYEMKA